MWGVLREKKSTDLESKNRAREREDQREVDDLGEEDFFQKKLRGSVENVGTEEEVDEGLAGFVQGI